MTRPPDAPLSIARRAADSAGAVVLEVAGDLVLTSRDELGRAVEAAAREADRVVVDLSGATHVDTPGFALLVRLHDACADANVALVVAGLPAAFREVSDALRLPDALRMVDDVEAAFDPTA